MRLAKGSWIWIFPFFVPLPLIFLNNLFLLIALPSAGFGIFQIWFFRDPTRKIVQDQSLIYAPADGKVISTDVLQNESNHELRLSIRMSPFDVHIIRAPMDFEIKKIEHHPGTHKSVYFAGAEQKNERKLVFGQWKSNPLELLLLTGAFARRIDLWVKENDKCSQGEKLGIIRFGSQTNVRFQTKSSITLLVEKGNNVRAGLTPIARID